MSGLEFVASLVDSLAWPVALVLIVRMIARAYSDAFEDDDK